MWKLALATETGEQVGSWYFLNYLNTYETRVSTCGGWRK